MQGAAYFFALSMGAGLPGSPQAAKSSALVGVDFFESLTLRLRPALCSLRARLALARMV